MILQCQYIEKSDNFPSKHSLLNEYNKYKSIINNTIYNINFIFLFNNILYRIVLSPDDNNALIIQLKEGCSFVVLTKQAFERDIIALVGRTFFELFALTLESDED